MRAPRDPAPPLPPPLDALFRALAHAGRPAELPAGAAEPAATHWVQGEAGRRRDGAQIRFHLLVGGDGQILQVRFEAFAGPQVLAVIEGLSGQLEGRNVRDGVPGSPQDWLDGFQLPAERLGPLLVLEDALCVAVGQALRVLGLQGVAPA